MRHVFHLVGPPGSGKRTIGLELSALTGAILLDNHPFNDAVSKPYGADGLRPIPDEIHALAAEVRRLGLEAARLAPRDVNQIFTSYLTNRPSGPAALSLVRDLAAARDAHYVPVWLECGLEELERRLPLPKRLERAKLRDPAILRATLQTSGVLPARHPHRYLGTGPGGRGAVDRGACRGAVLTPEALKIYVSRRPRPFTPFYFAALQGCLCGTPPSSLRAVPVNRRKENDFQYAR